MARAMPMSSVPFDVRNVKPDENPKKQVMSEISLNLRCGVRAVDTSHGMSHRKQISLHALLIEITCREGMQLDV